MDFIEILTPAEMAEADRLAIAGGTPGFELMERAGAAVAEAAARMAEGDILVLAGPGNNGGDGFVAARELRRAGRSVRLALLGNRGDLTGDAGLAAASYDGPEERLASESDLSSTLVIDALFGAGLSRALDGLAASVVERTNASGVPVLAVDLPSGIDGRTGEVRGAAVRAIRTVTFFRLKPGHLLMPGRAYCGGVEVAQIGIPGAVLDRIRPKAFHNGRGLWKRHLRSPDAADHKYVRGHAVVVSGPAASTGAARLAAAAALRIGAGVVTVASPPDAVLVNAAQLTAVMVRGLDSPDALGRLLDHRCRAVLVGPGNGTGEYTRRNVDAALASDTAVVLDADGLTSFAGAPERLFAMVACREASVVLTPHEGEFARLFDIQGPRIDRVRAAAAQSGAVLVLKGPDTIIAAPDGRIAINSNAPPSLATAGSGDVLAGMITGLLAQGVPGFEAAASAVWMHGAAAAAFGPGLIAEDLPPALPAVLQALEGNGGG
jgi:hydroxyethylthiazole kinase-like uncharacterized protein yjeF